MNCVPTHRTFTEYNTCDQPYDITSQRLGYGDYGETYVACCHGNCNYVAKLQPRTLDEKDDDENTVRDEIQYQQQAASHYLAPRVMEIMECEEGSAFIMDRLEDTSHHDFESLFPVQIEFAHQTAFEVLKRYYLALREQLTVSVEPIDIEWCKSHMNIIKDFRRRIPSLTDARLIQRFKYEVKKALTIVFPEEPLWQWIPPEPTDSDYNQYDPSLLTQWILPDSEEQKLDRTVRLALIIRLIRRLHNKTHLIHDDAHGFNIMRHGEDIWTDAEYQMIDFGLAYPIDRASSKDKDVDLKKYKRGAPFQRYHHLEYLEPIFNRLRLWVTVRTTDADIRNKKRLMRTIRGLPQKKSQRKKK